MSLFIRIKRYFSTCCTSLKAFVFTRRTNGEQPPLGPAQCPISGETADKRTFFAWQRNHMANERTFLAWCRTGISLIAFGFVIERFDILMREMRLFADRPGFSTLPSTGYLGIITFLIGALIILLAGWRFFYMRRHINTGETDISILPDLFLMGSVLIMVAAAFVFFAFFF